MTNNMLMGATLEKTGNGAKLKGIANSFKTSRNNVTVSQSAGESVVGKVVPLLVDHSWTTQSTVGQATMTGVTEEGLTFEATLNASHPDYNMHKENIELGAMSVSVGFIAEEFNDKNEVTKMDLMELSLTPTPADSKATVSLQSMAIDLGYEVDDIVTESVEESQNIEDDLTPVNPSMAVVLSQLPQLNKEWSQVSARNEELTAKVKELSYDVANLRKSTDDNKALVQAQQEQLAGKDKTIATLQANANELRDTVAKLNKAIEAGRGALSQNLGISDGNKALINQAINKELF